MVILSGNCDKVNMNRKGIVLTKTGKLGKIVLKGKGGSCLTGF